VRSMRLTVSMYSPFGARRDMMGGFCRIAGPGDGGWRRVGRWSVLFWAVAGPMSWACGAAFTQATRGPQSWHMQWDSALHVNIDSII
jgi:hypothetical protein